MKFQDFLATKNLKLEDFETKTTKEQAELHSEYQQKIVSDLEEKVKGKADASVIEAAKATLEYFKELGVDKFKAMVTEHIELMKNVKAMKEAPGAPSNAFAEVEKFLNEKKTEIKNLYKAGHGTLEIEVKAVGTITTANATNQGTVPTQYGEMTGPNIVGSWIEGYTTTTSTNASSYPYTEVVPKDGDYSFLTEGQTKPQIDFKMETRFVQPTKVAAWEKITEEAADDVPRMNDLARMVLLKKHNIFKQRGIISGDGVSPNPKGITEYGRAFVPGSMAGKVPSPNIMDVINACIVDIKTTHNYQDETPYIANVVMLNDVDFFINVQAAKDGMGRPLFDYNPITQTARMGSVVVVPTEEIEAGNILVADVSKYNVVNYKPYTVRVGWVNDDFIKNQFVILGESRFYAYVKKLDEQAFIYDSIATIKDAIAAV